jgi:hypothetical protein
MARRSEVAMIPLAGPRTKLGATSAAPILAATYDANGRPLGSSPFSSDHDLWRSLQGFGGATAPAMVRGLACEDPLARRISGLAGADLQRVEPVSIHDWLRISGDYRVGRTGYELKTSGFFAHERWDGLPDYYHAQAVLEAWAFGFDEVIVPALIIPSAFGALESMTIDMAPADRDRAIWAMAPVIVHAAEIQVYRVERDDEYAEAIVRIMGAWWQRHVIGGEPPAVTATDAWRDYARVHLPEREPLRVAETHEIALAEAYVRARDAESEARRVKEDLGAKLRAAIGTARGIKTGHGYAIAKPTSAKTSWEAAAIELSNMLQLRGVATAEVFAKHTKSTEGRSLDVKIAALSAGEKAA